VSTDELKRVKAQVIANNVYQRDSTFYQAMQLGEYVSAGLPVTAVADHVAKIQAVTAVQVQAVARKYLIDSGLTVATLDPQPINKTTPRAPVAGMRHVN
jgi:zinc protease